MLAFRAFIPYSNIEVSYKLFPDSLSDYLKEPDDAQETWGISSVLLHNGNEYFGLLTT